jgi:hypothetical protein
LLLALALYQFEEGKPAPTLEVLVPRFLPGLPLDPYSGQPFHYRVSQGEKIERRNSSLNRVEKIEDVPAGQGILWSIGPDRKKDDGIKGFDSQYRLGPFRGGDLIFLVPQWPKP